MKMEPRKIEVEERFAGARLDLFLAHVLVRDFSRSQIKKMIGEERVHVSGHKATPHYRVKKDDKITVFYEPCISWGARAEDIPIHILYEDDSVIVVNKSAGMVVHPAHGNLEHTLVNALLYHIRELSEFGDSIRPGIVHRLDKDTSGVLVIAKNEKSHRNLARQFKNHDVQRIYHGIVKGVVQHDEGFCEEPVGRAFLNRKKVVVKPSGGRAAKTYFKVLRRFREATLLEIRPQTGRTHQIRVHMAHLGHPVLGDVLYGVRSEHIGRQALHAKGLGFEHPENGRNLYFESDLPLDMQEALGRLESQE